MSEDWGIIMSAERTMKLPASCLRKAGTLVDLLMGMPHGDPRYALFLGAGASVSSGIPPARVLVSHWKRRLYLSERHLDFWQPHFVDDYRYWSEREYPRWKVEWQNRYGREPNEYSLLFSYAYPNPDARQGYIERLVSGCEPGPGYIYLTALATAGYFRTFLTTNFDDLVHDALFRYGGFKPMVCAFDSQVRSIRLTSPRPKIIKLHGDFLFSNLRSTSSETGHLDRNMEEKFGRTCETYGLIVVGYSGLDQSVMDPIRTMLHSRDRLEHGLHWCLFSGASTNDQDVQDSREVPETIYRMWEAYPDKFHLYDTGTFDDIMETLYLGTRASPPEDLARPEEKALYARLRDGIENADQTWQLSKKFSQLLEQFREASTRKPPAYLTLLDEADQRHRLGTAAIKAKQYEQADEHFMWVLSNIPILLSKMSPFHQVRACRRISGSATSLAESRIKACGEESSIAIVEGLREGVLNHYTMAATMAERGVELDHQLGEPSELRGHRLNLRFNGLTAYSGILDGVGHLTQPQSDSALALLEGLAGDEIHGDEYVALLRKEIGGERLLEELLICARTKTRHQL